MMTKSPAPGLGPMLFVLRWDPDHGWGHLAIHTGSGKPKLMGLVDLECDSLFAALVRKYSVPCGRGLRETWFTGESWSQARQTLEDKEHGSVR